ncbi:MAG: TonB-dependent receptor [Gammaproteobacteria bacterium]|nr:TonB-dependent receptor [Gammaproteobacteria bacterium]
MKHNDFKKSKVANIENLAIKGLAVSVLSLPLAQMSFAEEASSEKESRRNEIQTIVVRGIRGSVKESLNIKRFDSNFVDAISAEDVGKLPDRNVAEALQRIPGVAIQRDRGEGDFVSIRGLSPDFVRGSVNGRTLVSGTESFDSTLDGGAASTTGRATNFDVLPSEIINTLEVFKTASAEHVEGGIGGSVNIKTARPLELGNKTAGSIRGQYSDFSEETKPSGSLLHSWVNDDETFGAVVSVSLSQRAIREDLGNSFGYANWQSLDTDGDGLGDTGSETLGAFSANPEIFTEERDRQTFNASLQWRLDSTDIVFDTLYSKRDIDSSQYGAIYSLYAFSHAGVEMCSVSGNADGSITCPEAVIQDGTLTSFPTIANIETFTDVRHGEDESLNLGLNIEHEVGNWIFTGDIAYAKADGVLNVGRSVLSFVDGVQDATNIVRTVEGTASTSNDVVNFTPTADDAQLQNPDNYAIQQIELKNRFNSDEESSLKFDAAYDTGADGITEVKVGVRWRSREKDFNDFTGTDSGRLNPVLLGNAYQAAPSNFLNSTMPGLTPSDLLFPDHNANLANRGQNIVMTENTLGSFNAQEDTLAAYLQLEINSELGDMPLSGNAGVRIVNTNTDVVGQSQTLTLEQQGAINVPVLSGPVEEFPFDNSYTNFLPSLNLKLDVSEDVVSRFSYSQTITRPEFTDLAPSLNIVNATNFIAAFGNPNLKPYTADNLDLGIEWYFEESSALTASLYYKEIADYIVATNNTDVEISGVTFKSVSQPDNQGKATISGLEIGYTQAFTFLPEPLDGLGLTFNLTTVNADLELNSGKEISFPGISDLSMNSAIYYDNGPIQARLAYSWRDEFLLVPVDVFGASEIWSDSYGQFDLSFKYEIAENLNVFVEVINLTDEQEKVFTTSDLTSGNGKRPLSLGQVGRKLGLGISFNF